MRGTVEFAWVGGRSFWLRTKDDAPSGCFAGINLALFATFAVSSLRFLVSSCPVMTSRFYCTVMSSSPCFGTEYHRSLKLAFLCRAQVSHAAK